jgi:lipopolysaccharide/colanic/teichoic acid biosynthesis glycosyltransferase
MLKRAFDVALSLVGFIFLSPVFIVIPIMIKLDSEGPVFFCQKRIGKGLRRFTMYKFRTMFFNRAPGDITMADDGRVTRIGKLLRVTKLDEIPQLWNILIGEMTFVGPRPLLESAVMRFCEDYRVILRDARPGVTDAASIKYRHESEILGACSDPVDFYFRRIMPDKIRLQKEYLRHQTFLGDIKILWETLAACSRLDIADAHAIQPEKVSPMSIGTRETSVAPEVYSRRWSAVSAHGEEPRASN